MRKTLAWTTLAAAVAIAVPAGRATAWDPEADQKEKQAVEKTLEAFRKSEPRLQAYFDSCYGYAVFPTVGKGGFIIGGAHGKGRVFVGGKLVGSSTISQGSIGATIGFETFSELIFFGNKEAFEAFKNGEAKFAARASAYAIKAGGAKAANYSDGVAVFVKGKGGLMADASIGGQGFTFEPL
jgi:lipid-binding SYLF domain-containing protein